MYTTARVVSSFPVTHRPIVTAGLTIPPEMCPMIETMIASVSPWARATPTRPPSEIPVMTTAPAPMKISANVAMNSATAAFPMPSNAFLLRRSGAAARDRSGREAQARGTASAWTIVDARAAGKALGSASRMPT